MVLQNLGKCIGKYKNFKIYKFVEEFINPLATGVENIGHGNYMQTTLYALDDFGNVVKTWIRKTKTDLYPDVARREVSAVAPTKASWDVISDGFTSSTQFGDRRFWKQVEKKDAVQIDLTPDGKNVIRTFGISNPRANFDTVHNIYPKYTSVADYLKI